MKDVNYHVYETLLGLLIMIIGVGVLVGYFLVIRDAALTFVGLLKVLTIIPFLLVIDLLRGDRP